jgi:hypothetical protein
MKYIKPFIISLLIVFGLGSQLVGQITATGWRLTGLANLPDLRAAALEHKQFGLMILKEGEKGWDFTLVKIDFKKHTVDLRGRDKSMQLDLNDPELTNHLTANTTLVFDNASEAVLFGMYSDLVKRTLLRHPRLPKGAFTAGLETGDSIAAAHAIESHFIEQGMAVIPDGPTFTMIVPANLEEDIKKDVLTNKAPEPNGVRDISYNFPNMPMVQMLDVYAALFNRRLELNAEYWVVPPTAGISLQTESRLNKEEAIYALGTLAKWNGVKLTPAGQDLMKPVPVGNPAK